LRAVLPDGVDNPTIRNRTRQITGYVTENGRLPANLCELEQPPTVARQVSLAAADRQQVVVDRIDEATVRVWAQLPAGCLTVSVRRDGHPRRPTRFSRYRARFPPAHANPIGSAGLSAAAAFTATYTPPRSTTKVAVPA
jgi:hypothetical protein